MYLKRSLTVVIVLVALCLIGVSYASRKHNYFDQILASIEVDVLKDFNKGTYLTKYENQNQFSLVLTSDLHTSDFKFLTNTLLICDSAYAYKDHFSCDYNGVVGDNLSQLNYRNYTFQTFKEQETSNLIIPESVFYDESSRSAIKGLIKELYTSGIVPVKVSNRILTALDTVLNLDIFILTLNLLLLVALLGSVKLRFLKSRLLLCNTCLLVAAWCFFIPAITYLYVRSTDEFSPASLINLALSYLNPVLFIQDIRDMYLLEIGLVFSMFVIVVTSLILFILPMFIYAYRSLRGSVNIETSKYLINILLPALILIYVLKLESSTAMVLKLLVLVSMLILTNVRSSVSQETVHPLKQLRNFASILVLLMFSVTAVTVFKQDEVRQIADADTYLPLSLTNLANKSIEHVYAKTNTVLADNYVIYYPNAKLLNHMPLEKYSKGNNTIVVVHEAEDGLFETLFYNSDLRSLFASQTISPNLYFTAKRGNIYNLEILFDCTDVDTEVKLDYKPFYYNSGRQEFITNAKRTQLLNFAGCLTSTSDKVYTFSLSLPEGFTSGQLYLKFNDAFREHVKEVNLLENDKKIEVTYLNISDKMFLPPPKRGIHVMGDVTVYSQVSDQVKLDNTQDISVNLNLLRNNGLLTDNVELWSDVLGAFISRVRQ